MSNSNGLNVSSKSSINGPYVNTQVFNKPAFFGVLGIFVAILLILSLVGSLRSGFAGYSFSFKGLLDYLADAPSIKPEFSLNAWSISGDWGLFEFLRKFFSFFAKIFGFASWFTLLIWNAIKYVAYFFSFIFAIG